MKTAKVMKMQAAAGRMMMIGVVIWWAIAQDAGAMAGKAHNDLSLELLDVAPVKGGAKGLTPVTVKAVHDWMDNPASKTGEYVNHAVEKKVHPNNHGHMKHNPKAVARALSGNGRANPAVENVARLHKIQDVAHNTAGVDGYEITKQMRKDAENIIDFVEEYKHLPERLPGWVDSRGPLTADIIENGGKAVDKTAMGLKSGAKSAREVAKAGKVLGEVGKTAGKMAGKVAKVAGPIGIAVEAGIRGKDVYDTEKAYENGTISGDERLIRHSENGGGAVGGALGCGTAAWGCAVVGAVIAGPPGAIICGVGGALLGGIGGDAIGSRAAKAGAEMYLERNR